MNKYALVLMNEKEVQVEMHQTLPEARQVVKDYIVDDADILDCIHNKFRYLRTDELAAAVSFDELRTMLKESDRHVVIDREHEEYEFAGMRYYIREVECAG